MSTINKIPNFETFKTWIKFKYSLNIRKRKVILKEGRIMWCSFGQNIGYEIYGKGEQFSRPVIIYKVLGAYTFLGIPLTSKIKKGSWYFNFMHKGVSQTVILAQLRIMDSKRLLNDFGYLDEKDYQRLRKNIKNFIS